MEYTPSSTNSTEFFVVILYGPWPRWIELSKKKIEDCRPRWSLLHIRRIIMHEQRYERHSTDHYVTEKKCTGGTYKSERAGISEATNLTRISPALVAHLVKEWRLTVGYVTVNGF